MMSISSDGAKNDAGDPYLSSEATGVDLVEEARQKMEATIINVNQFYPEITGGIKVYSDKFSFLADNAADIPVEKSIVTPAGKQEEEKGSGDGEEKGKGEGGEGGAATAAAAAAAAAAEGEGGAATKAAAAAAEKGEGEGGAATEAAAAAAAAAEGEGRGAKETVADEAEKDGVFRTELESPSAQPLSTETTNLLFLPEHWSLRGHDSSSMRNVISDSTAEHYKAGQIAAKLEQYDTALVHFSKCVKLRPNEAVYYVRRAEIFLTLCDFASAILNYKRACILEPTNRDHFQRLAFLYLLHGQSLFDQKLYPEALEHFSRAAEMQPERSSYQTRSLACLAALQRHGECLALVNKRLEADNSNADLYVMRARLHRMFRNYSLCYYDLKDALSIVSSHTAAQAMLVELAAKAQEFNARAVELALSGRTREALQRVSLAVEMDPTVAAFHVKRGAFHRRLGDYNAAIDDYLLALDKADHDEASPIYAESQRQLLLTFNDFAVECFAKGYYEEAIVLLNKAIKAEKREAGLYVNRGDCFYRQGELDFALADFHQALELQAEDELTIHARIALVHHRRGQDAFANRKAASEAEAEFGMAIAHNPSVAHFWMARARVRHAGDRNADGARRDVAAALLLRPGAQDPEDGSMSLVSRLFPGQTLTEVTNSPTAAAAREELERAVRAMLPRAEVMVSAPQAVRKASRRRRRAAGGVRSRAVPSLRECISEKALYAEIVEEKRALDARVKQRQRERQSLKASGAKVLPMKGPSELLRKGTVARGGDRLEKEELLNERGQTVGREGEVKGWRQFSLGIGTA